MEKRLDELNASYLDLQALIDSAGSGCNNIPAIQPVINKQLTLLTASYGMRIHPFYKTLQSHQGVDYTIPEGSRVFATADGVVRDVALRNSTSGQTVVIDHGNGYETSYSHLSKINVRKGQRVSRGEIIALSGDTGLSLSPHLHYEVRLNGMRVDPIHYFFMELTPHRIPAPDAHRTVGHAVVRLKTKEMETTGQRISALRAKKFSAAKKRSAQSAISVPHGAANRSSSGRNSRTTPFSGGRTTPNGMP